MSVHAQILNLLADLQQKLGMTYLFISHNLAVVKDICPSVAVMYLGCVMETGVTRTIFDNPLHPYTQSLLSAVLDVDVDSKRERVILKGNSEPHRRALRLPVLHPLPQGRASLRGKTAGAGSGRAGAFRFLPLSRTPVTGTRVCAVPFSAHETVRNNHTNTGPIK